MFDIAIRHDGPYLDDKPLEDEFYLQSYKDLAEVLQQRGARLFLVKDDNTYAGGNRFTKGWVWKNGIFCETRQPFDTDVIFNKDSAFFPDADAIMVNDKHFDLLCNDKKSVAELFPSLCPVTCTIRSAADIDSAFAAIPSQKIVVKPLDDFGGTGVFIGEREEARDRIKEFPYLAQEFIDCSDGIPGLTDTYHDLRMIVMDGEPVFSFYRTPQPGSLISNFSLGGWMTPLRRWMWPQEMLEMVKTVDCEFRIRFPKRIYSVDCARNADGQWKLIELNAPPGQQNRMECGDEADHYFEKHADFLLDPPRTSGVSWRNAMPVNANTHASHP